MVKLKGLDRSLMPVLTMTLALSGGLISACNDKGSSPGGSPAAPAAPSANVSKTANGVSKSGASPFNPVKTSKTAKNIDELTLSTDPIVNEAVKKFFQAPIVEGRTYGQDDKITTGEINYGKGRKTGLTIITSNLGYGLNTRPNAIVNQEEINKDPSVRPLTVQDYLTQFASRYTMRGFLKFQQNYGFALLPISEGGLGRTPKDALVIAKVITGKGDGDAARSERMQHLWAKIIDHSGSSTILAKHGDGYYDGEAVPLIRYAQDRSVDAKSDSLTSGQITDELNKLKVDAAKAAADKVKADAAKAKVKSDADAKAIADLRTKAEQQTKAQQEEKRQAKLKAGANAAPKAATNAPVSNVKSNSVTGGHGGVENFTIEDAQRWSNLNSAGDALRAWTDTLNDTNRQPRIDFSQFRIEPKY